MVFRSVAYGAMVFSALPHGATVARAALLIEIWLSQYRPLRVWRYVVPPPKQATAWFIRAGGNVAGFAQLGGLLITPCGSPITVRWGVRPSEVTMSSARRPERARRSDSER